MSKLLLLIFLTLALGLLISCDVLTSLPQDANTVNNEAKLDRYFYLKGNIGGRSEVQWVELKTIGQWESDRSRKISFRTAKAPWILNAGFNVTSKLSSSYELILHKKTDIEGVTMIIPIRDLGQELTAVIDDTGDFIIDVQVSGMKWWVRVGIE